MTRRKTAGRKVLRFWAITSLLVLASAPILLAQGDFGAGGSPSEATLLVSGLYRYYKLVAQIVSAICALIGGVKVYGKIMDGGSESRRSILVWFSASLFCLFIEPILDLLFRV